MPTDAAARSNPATLGWMLPLVVAGGALIVAAKLLAGPLVLPLLSLLLLGAGFVVGMALLLAGSRIGQDRGAAWVAAGALVFLGFAAALLSEGHETLALIERMQASTLASAGR